jgi:hypothetical protein
MGDNIFSLQVKISKPDQAVERWRFQDKQTFELIQSDPKKNRRSIVRLQNMPVVPGIIWQLKHTILLIFNCLADILARLPECLAGLLTSLPESLAGFLPGLLEPFADSYAGFFRRLTGCHTQFLETLADFFAPFLETLFCPGQRGEEKRECEDDQDLCIHGCHSLLYDLC